MNILNKVFKKHEYILELFTKEIGKTISELFVLCELLGNVNFNDIAQCYVGNDMYKVTIRFKKESDRDKFMSNVATLGVSYFGTSTYKQ